MPELTRRRFLQYGVGAGAALTVPWALPRSASAAMGGKLVPYLTPLPTLGNGIIVKSGATSYDFELKEIAKQLHPQLPQTPVWAYDDGSGLDRQTGSFGMAIVAQRGTPLTIHYKHSLPATYPARIPVDTRLTVPFGNQVQMLTHLHGGLVTGVNDGNPAASVPYLSGQTQTAVYPNDQPATLAWFHDHALGATRLNVFAGLAAAYIVRDQNDPGGLLNAPEIPLVIQDRQFNPDGTFLYPTSKIPGVTWIGEYFGDVMLVNGVVWPFLNVDPRLYRFRVLNGCNARILDLNFPGATPMWQIGAEGGMFDKPVPIKALVMSPGERADVLVDFSAMAGQTIVVKNTNPPKPVFTPAPPLPNVMEIRVNNTTPSTTTIPATLPGRAANLNPGTVKRYITLNEVNIGLPNWRLTLNGDGFDDIDPDPNATPTPAPGATEDWYYINLTGDTHPMHIHLVTFQVVERRPFNATAYMAAVTAAGGAGPGGFAGIDPTPFYKGGPAPADPTERGFKDTVKANPGYVTIIRAKFDLPTGVTAPQKYVHHCHIVEHEDNDMMRPFTVT